MAEAHNNVKAGLFMAVGIILTLAVIVVLADLKRLMTPKQTVAVRFALADGLQGLKDGAQVTIGNVPAGAVTAIEHHEESGVVVAAVVNFTIPKAYKLYDNAMIELVVPPLGSGTKLNIKDFGSQVEGEGYSGSSWLYEAGDDPIKGGIESSRLTRDLTKDMGIREEQRQQIAAIIANVKKITDTVAAEPQKLTQIIDNARDTTANLKDTSEKLKTFVADATERREKWFARLDSITEKADEAIETARRMLTENEEVIKDALAKARDTMGNAKEITARVREQTLAKIHGALDKARAAVDDIKETTGDAKALLTGQRPVLERTIANARLVSDQLKLAAIEIRRSPWRLMYKPSDEELNTDNLYDSARSFALAASTLDSTTESMRAIVERYNGQEIDAGDTNLQLMLDNLHQSFEKFLAAETAFWEALDEQTAE